MALARCKECGIKHERVKEPYSGKAYYPVGHPDSGVVWGTKDCQKPAQVWLTFSEETMYQKGIRIFEFKSNVAKVRLSDPLRAKD